MNQISRHISYLLLSCRKVYVPSLGMFSLANEHAYYDSVFGVFYPSRIRVNFEKNSCESSILLRNSLKRKLNLKESEAQMMIDDFIEKVKSKLKTNHYCKIDGIGYLIDRNGNIYLKDTFLNSYKE